MKMGPNPNQMYPNENIKQLIFLKASIKNPNIDVGEYTYYDKSNADDDFEAHVTHFYEFIGDKLTIGKFCSIASGVEFIMNGANHNMSGITTYPFDIFGNGWERYQQNLDQFPHKGNTQIGNDVWIGQNVTFLPGVKVGNGAIIGANTVVTKNIPAYSIVGGNPGKVIRNRFTPDIIEELEKLAWWDREIEWINNNIPLLMKHNPTLQAIRALNV